MGWNTVERAIKTERERERERFSTNTLRYVWTLNSQSLAMLYTSTYV